MKTFSFPLSPSGTLAVSGLLLATFTLGCAARAPYISHRHDDTPTPDCRRYAIATQDFSVKDDQRTYAITEGATPIPRRLEATLWYPVGAPAGPLIVYSHGFLSSRTEGVYVTRALAQCGYVVVAADYPRSRMGAEGGSRLDDVVNQPGDVSLLIDQLLAFNQTFGHSLEKKIDPLRIGVMGVSLGGLTSALVTFHPKLHDTRIKAAVSIAAPAELLGPAFFATRDVPYLLIYGDNDSVINYANNGRATFRKVPNSSLVTLHRATHSAFADATTWLFWMRAHDDLGCYALNRYLPAKDVNPFEKLGDESVGLVIPFRSSRPCAHPSTQLAMRPHRQHVLTRLAVTAFFESIFANDAQQKARFGEYLGRDFAKQNPDVRVEGQIRASIH